MSKVKRLMDALFSSHEEVKYEQALDKLNRVYRKVYTTNMVFPNVRSVDFDVAKNEWRKLPDDVSTNVQTMGLHIDEDYRSMICHYGSDGEILPHKHETEWEVVKILEGSCLDEVTGTALEKGDVYIIPKAAEHHIITKSEECYMYILFTENKENLVIPHVEKDFAQDFIKNNKIDSSKVMPS